MKKDEKTNVKFVKQKERQYGRKAKGITLIALVITIIVLLILAGVSIASLTGEKGILTKATTAKEKTEQESIREEIEIAAMSSFDEHGKFDAEKFMDELKKQFGDRVECYYEDEETKDVIIVEVDGYEVRVDAKTGEIIGEIEKAGVRPVFTVEQTLDSTSKEVTLKVTVTNEVGKVDKITITNLEQGTDLDVTLDGKTGTAKTKLNGTYKIVVTATTDGSQKSASKVEEVNQIPVTFSMKYGKIEVVWIDKGNKVIKDPLAPVLIDNEMKPVVWEGDGDTPTEKEGVDANNNSNSWYEYKAGTGKDDNLTSRWANVKYKDSYLVWIPRYAYRITYYESETSDQVVGYCDAKGIRAVGTAGEQEKYSFGEVDSVESDGKSYIVHPAFKNGTDNSFKNGEWDKELSGIWVAKYEMSGSSNSYKSVPDVASARNLTIDQMFTGSKSFASEKESHLMKNSEWGAVAYLTQSQYGRNGHEVDINNSSSYITGSGGGSTNASSASNTTNAYNTTKGMKASTTGNIYGIYDMSGGAWEYVAGYISNGNSSLTTYGKSIVGENYSKGENDYQTKSTKYATVYPYDSSSDSYTNNYTAYKEAKYGYGDAILETSTSGSGSTSWFGDFSYFPDSSSPFFLRGGYCSRGAGAGLFCFSDGSGSSHSGHSFRVALPGE